MSLTEYDEEETFRNFYEDGVEQGMQAKAIEAAVMLVNKYNADPEIAAKDMNAPLDKVLERLGKEGL